MPSCSYIDALSRATKIPLESRARGLEEKTVLMRLLALRGHGVNALLAVELAEQEAVI